MADDQDLTPKWRRKGTFKWFGDDETEEDLIKGKYTIEFKPLKGYKTPEDMEVEIHENECLKIDVVYKKIHITGSLQITVLPDYEIVKDFKWRAKGTTGWFSSGETQNNITPGVYDVEFLETEFCKVTDQVKVNILESYVTKLNYTVIVTGPPGIIEVEPGIKDIKEVRVVKRIPKDKYNVTISGGETYVTPDSIEVNYGEKTSFDIKGSYKFKSKGIEEFFTPHGPVESITTDKLKTGIILNDSDYSFNIAWINILNEDIGLKSGTVTKASIYNKDKVLEEIGFTDISSVSAFKRKAYINISDVIKEELGFLSNDELSVTKATPKIKETLDNSPVITSGVVLDVIKLKRFKEPSFKEETLLMSDVIYEVHKRNIDKNAANIKEDSVWMTDIISNVIKKIRYKSDILKEDLGFSSPDILSVTKKDNFLVKPSFKPGEEIAFTAINDVVVNKSNLSLNRTDSKINEEVGLLDIKETELTITIKLKSSTLNEELGIKDINFIEIEKRSKLRNNFSLEEIGIAANDELEVIVTNKFPNVNIVEDLGILSPIDITVSKENKYLNRSKLTLEELGLLSSTLENVTISDSKIHKTYMEEEALGFEDISSISAEKRNPKLQPSIKQEEELGFLSGDIEDITIRKAMEHNSILENSFTAADIVYDVIKKSNLKPNISQTESVMMSDTDFACSKKSHLIKNSFIEELGIKSIHSIEADKKSHILKTSFISEIGVNSINELEVTKNNKVIEDIIETEELGFTDITELEVIIT